MSRRFRDLHTPTSDTSAQPGAGALFVDIDTLYDEDPGDELLFPEFQRGKSLTPALITIESQASSNGTQPQPQPLGLGRDHEVPYPVPVDQVDDDDDDDPFSYLDELEDSAQESRDALAALGAASDPISVASSPLSAAPELEMDEGGEDGTIVHDDLVKSEPPSYRQSAAVDNLALPVETTLSSPVANPPFFPSPPSQTEEDVITSKRKTRCSSRNLARLSQSQSDFVMNATRNPDPSKAFVDPLEQLDRPDSKIEVDSKKRAIGSRVGFTQRGSKRKRQNLGQPARLAITGMAASDGKVRVEGAKWPTKAEYTTKSRLGEIQCNTCYGWRVPLAEQRPNGSSGHQADRYPRAHFACAGFASKKDVDETIEWVCPDCEVLQAREESVPTMGDSKHCLRPSCVRRDHQRLRVEEGDQDVYQVERIVGKRTLVPCADGRKREAYLIKWCDWHVKHSTWALPEQIDGPASLVATFFQACMEARVEFNAPLALLPETLDDWTEEGVAKDPQAYSNLDPFVDAEAEKRFK